MDILTRKQLEILLSKLESFKEPKIRLEQYPTDPSLASELLWFAKLKGDIENKVIADLGAGTGILGIGSLLLKAKKVYFVEIDESSIEILKKNLKKFDISEEFYQILNINVRDFSTKVDTVIMNPPFGTHIKNIDIHFFNAALKNSNVIYCIHDLNAKDFVLRYFIDKGWKITDIKESRMTIKYLYGFHQKPKKKIDVFWFRAVKI